MRNFKSIDLIVYYNSNSRRYNANVFKSKILIL